MSKWWGNLLLYLNNKGENPLTQLNWTQDFEILNL
jgi:hypothetical protein